MHEPDRLHPCVACGEPTRREEMFGPASELRCPACAHALRRRVEPARLRRPTLAAAGRAPDGLATKVVLVVLGALFLAGEGPAKELLHRVLYEHVTMRPQGSGAGTTWVMGGHPQAWQICLWALLHGGAVHVFFNGMALWQMGRWIEWGWGIRTFLFVLLGAAVAGVAAGWLVNGRVTIGLSGGLFALEGWLLAQRKNHALATAIVTRRFLNGLLVTAALMIVLTETGTYPVSHVGHAVGFLWGLAAGYAASRPWRRLGYAALVLLTVALVLLPHYVEPLGLRLTLFGRGA